MPEVLGAQVLPSLVDDIRSHTVVYPVLEFTILAIRVLTILYIAVATLGLFASIPDDGELLLVYVLTGALGIVTHAFFMWVAADVIRILLHIRGHQEA